MSKDRHDSQQDQQQRFSDFLLESIGPDENGFSGFNFPTTQDSRELSVVESRDQLVQPSLPPFPAYSHSDKGYLDYNGLLDNDAVFINQQPPFTHGANHSTYVPPYTTCPNTQQYPHQNAQNAHVTNQNNYDGYLHSSSPDSGDRASISNSPYTPTVRQDFSLSPSGNVPQQNTKSGTIPSVSNYPGEHDFEIYFGNHTESAVKSAQYTYSAMLGKLFVKMNVLCPIQFRCMKQPPIGSFVRALPVYIRPEHVTDIVTRCPNHLVKDGNTDRVVRHLIRAEQPGNNSVNYVTSPDGRESVTVAYMPPEIGSDYVTVFYKYMCLSSCVGGINRRPIMMIFTLESAEGNILGRRCVEVRVCSCPGRDRSQEEKRKRKPPSGYVILPKKKKSAAMPSTSTAEPGNGETQEFFLRVKGKEKYEILKKIKEALDLKELVSQEQKEEYQKEQSEDESAMKQILSNYFKKDDRDGSGPFPT